VSYTQKQAFHYHTDWFPLEAVAPDASGNRASSFFAYVQARNLTGGGTNFPPLDAPWDEKWCEFVDCDEETEKGVTFRPVEGNAIFWVNLFEDGRGDERTLHAGLPVTSGNKVGMNIWTRQGVVGEELRGADTDD
jgi:prolyl 4-hydroxylase